VISTERFAELFASTHDALWCVAAAVLGDRSRAHDVVQEAALIGMAKLGEFDPDTSFVAWMGQIVRFTALNEGRKHQREREGLVRLASRSGSGIAPGPHSDTGSRGRTLSDVERFDAALEDALSSLDPTARACVVLRSVRGMAYKEIASTLGIPEGTAMSHVCRARRELRERLASRDPYAGARAGKEDAS
jgi:RNA polymerase sigma-70 factor (ECF subfamily)